MKKYLLAIESSCDDSAVAVINTDYSVLANIISSQPEHELYGGIFPELAARLHLNNLPLCFQRALHTANIALEEIAAIAVSVNPGLIGSLLVGVAFAKSLAWSLQVPLIPVNHLLGHVMAIKLDDPFFSPPWLALVVSGGHTELVVFQTADDFQIIGQTVDDAAGEAFDKIAKLLKLGFPGGPRIDKIAQQGNQLFHQFPRAMIRKNNYNFSFSGLKTSVLTYIKNRGSDFVQTNLADVCASIQQAIVDILVLKTINAAQQFQMKKIIVAGGVSANSCLRKNFHEACIKHKLQVFFPQFEYCTDNAAMIGAAAIPKYYRQEFADLSLNPFSTKGIKK